MATPTGDRGGGHGSDEAPQMEAASEVTQLVAIGAGEVARIAVRAAHERAHPRAVAGVELVPVVAAGAQDLEEDQPGSQSAEHVSTLPGREDRSPRQPT
jgi:hypothetical protein